MCLMISMFTIHNGSFHSIHTDNVGVECRNFPLHYELNQIITFPTSISDAPNQFSSLIDLFLTSIPELCTPTQLPPLGSSDHCVVCVSIDMPLKSSTEVPFHRPIFRYAQADWDSFRSYIADGPSQPAFERRNDVETTPSLNVDMTSKLSRNGDAR